MASRHTLKNMLQQLAARDLNALDFLSGGSLAEKMTALALGTETGVAPPLISTLFQEFKQQVDALDVSGVKVVVFGGGTGLSNVIGGDSRRPDWKFNSFSGLKVLFPRIHSVVCVTDDGGSTGELLKDLPLVALGDLRHVLLSSVRRDSLVERYDLESSAAANVTVSLHALFNYRFITRPESPEQLLLDTGTVMEYLPEQMASYITEQVARLFTDNRLKPTLVRPQCLGNLLLASAIYKQLDPELDAIQLLTSPHVVRTATIRGLAELSSVIGVAKNSVLPCSTTLSQLQVQYANGVCVTGESKSADAMRGYPVDRVMIEFCRAPFLQPEVVQMVEQADIILFAPGSLYTSIIPILQFPGLADIIRGNSRALKLLVSNIWVQRGETDVARDNPGRKFHVSDLVRAYHRNIPGGVHGLFSHIISIDLGDIPGSVLQRYALENKEPIYLDRNRVRTLGFESIEAYIFSKSMLDERGAIQHDPDALAQAVKTLWGLKHCGYLTSTPEVEPLPAPPMAVFKPCQEKTPPCQRYESIRTQLQYISTGQLTIQSPYEVKLTEIERRWLLDRVVEIVWLHPDIQLEHLRYIQGITLVDEGCWKRCQEWDNVFSFYDPQDKRIKIRKDQTNNINRFEMVFLVALGQSLLGNYALGKQLDEVQCDGDTVGRVYRLTVTEPRQLESFLGPKDLDTYLKLCRMNPSSTHDRLYTRVVSGTDGFTPPGLFFGLFYTWYLDNRFAPNIEYKVSIIKKDISNLIPEEVRIVERRKRTIDFFRERIFTQLLPAMA